ncbi:MAG: 2-phospho-L-lactate/phosphoenolpyruvate guanylyltransferase [Actinomycetota bacterium]|nr:2-phospho-L-lactate/phosphoenolpyruvate guanylyltransferase [Actinomycetota bacterium]
MRAIVLPVKSLSEAKSRLEPLLTPLERGVLTLAMLEDVLDATQALAGWDTWIISPDEAVLEIAVRRGAAPIVEESPSLQAAMAQVDEEAIGRGLDSLAVLLPDTPFVTTSALTRALHTLGPIVLGPATDGAGTNLLVRRPPSVLPARFGPDSYRRHLQGAAEAEIPTSVVELPEIGFDLDLPGDILTVLDAPRSGRTREVCEDMDLRSRIAVKA